MEASSPRPDPVPALEEAGIAVTRLWWLWLIFGTFWILVALVILQFDQASITTVGVLIGVMFLLSGFQQLALGALTGGWMQLVLFFFGLLLMVAGVIALISPQGFLDAEYAAPYDMKRLTADYLKGRVRR